MVRIYILLLFVCVLPCLGQSLSPTILSGDELSEGYGMGIDTDRKERDWLQKTDGSLCLSYPSGQKWGAAFITVGPPVPKPALSVDLSAYKFLVLEMVGKAGGEKLAIGIRDETQVPSAEAKTEQTLTADWKSYPIALSRFKGADLTKLYVVAELVFAGSKPQNVCVRSIKYSKD